MILLDALYPPGPAQLVADCQAAGAGGCWAYAARRDAGGRDLGIGSWTPAHVAALRGAGLAAPAVIVPGSAPGPVDAMLDGADQLGCDPPTAFDLETFSLPPPGWLAAAIARTRARGRRPLRYGDGPVLASYPSADGDWWSHGAIAVRAGSFLPVPALPPGLVADQYAVQVQLPSHASYDVSVADPNVFAEDPMDQPTFDALLRSSPLYRDLVAGILRGSLFTFDGQHEDAGFVQQFLSTVLANPASLDQVLASLQDDPANGWPASLHQLVADYQAGKLAGAPLVADVIRAIGVRLST